MVKKKQLSHAGTNTSGVKKTNWLDLPDCITANILHRVGVIDILESAQKVCTAWYKICKDPAMWRVIYMDNFRHFNYKGKYLVKICMHAIDRSQGQLVDISIEHIATKELMQHLAESERSSQLKRLEIAYGCSDDDDLWCEFFQKAPLLEEISLTFTYVSKQTATYAAQYCPMLKSFKYDDKGYRVYYLNSRTPLEAEEDDDFVKAIAKGMSQLCHLKLVGNQMTNVGLQAILDGCPQLVSLDLRRCFNINLDDSYRMKKLCMERIKDLRLPDDSMKGHKYKYQIKCCDDRECTLFADVFLRFYD